MRVWVLGVSAVNVSGECSGAMCMCCVNGECVDTVCVYVCVVHEWALAVRAVSECVSW